ncbi:MAG TPA: CpsD/CapB family tyrosine-protein kinase [Pyrinomonadaceae bacterium]|jgi:capsular exopolysaccharide synthesis family protein
MGRVYEALKRAAHGDEQDEETIMQARDAAQARDERAAPANGNGAHHADGPHAPDPLFDRSSAYFQAPEAHAAAHTSAPAEHTFGAPAGSALSGGAAARAAGATAGAGGSTRALAYPEVEVATARVEPHLVAVNAPRSPHAEQYRSLRTRILHAGERRKMQAVVVTSAEPGAGKTVTALNLAWLLAQTDGVRALLIDGDLRQPCAADYLALDAPAGLSEVLAGQATLDETVVRLAPAGLYFLPGGTPRDDCAELLSGPRFSDVLAQLRRTFNYILIDAPPLGIFSDASVLINRADGALVVVRAGKTRYGALDRALEPLPRERLLGVILNGAQGEAAQNNYYYQRRYYRRAAEAEDAAARKHEEAG